MVKVVATGVACIALLATTACRDARPPGAVGGATDSIPTQRSIVVSAAADLVPKLAAATAGTTVLLQAGEYEISHTLVIPDGVTLLGSGAMKLDTRGHLP